MVLDETKSKNLRLFLFYLLTSLPSKERFKKLPYEMKIYDFQDDFLKRISKKYN
jgi:hypothetical protein